LDVTFNFIHAFTLTGYLNTTSSFKEKNIRLNLHQQNGNAITGTVSVVMLASLVATAWQQGYFYFLMPPF